MPFTPLLLLVATSLASGCLPQKLPYSSRAPRSLRLFQILSRGRGSRSWLRTPALVQELLKPKTNPNSNPRCGFHSSILSPRMMGGEEPHPGDFPWVASLLLPSSSCSGVLVSPQHLLTAAHCSSPCSTSCSGTASFPNGETRGVAGVAHHPLYRRSSGVTPPSYDVALVLLSRPLEHLPPVCLPPWGLGLQGRLGTLVTSTTTGLEVAEVPLLGSRECAAQPGGSWPSMDQICGGRSGSRSAPCPGDSGAPLLLRKAGAWVVVGLVSHGPRECGATPVTYSRLETAMPWVLGQIGDMSGTV